MVQTPAKPVTLDEFRQRPETKPASEYIDGQVVQKPIPQGQHSTIQGELVTTINAATKGSRIAWALPELRCTFSGRSIVPDVAVFQWGRLPVNTDGTIANTFDAHPAGQLKSSAPTSHRLALPAISFIVSTTAANSGGSLTLTNDWCKFICPIIA